MDYYPFAMPNYYPFRCYARKYTFFKIYFYMLLPYMLQYCANIDVVARFYLFLLL